MTPRYSLRRPFVCGVTLSCESLVGHGTILNVSVPGCLIDTGLKLKVGHFIQMRLTLAPGTGIALDCARRRTMGPGFEGRYRIYLYVGGGSGPLAGICGFCGETPDLDME
jgi:hypothetical protein